MCSDKIRIVYFDSSAAFPLNVTLTCLMISEGGILKISPLQANRSVFMKIACPKDLNNQLNIFI